MEIFRLFAIRDRLVVLSIFCKEHGLEVITLLGFICGLKYMKCF